MRVLEFRENVHQMESSIIISSLFGGGLSSVFWALVSVCVLGGGLLTLEHKGSDTVFSVAVLLRHKGGTADSLLESEWVLPSVPGTIAFYIH